MAGNTIPFVVKLKEYIDQRNSKISEKKAVIADLRSQLQSKNGEISKLEEEYKQTFNDKLFEKLVQYKKDVDDIQANINKISEIVSLMSKGQFEYAPQKIEKEIESYIENRDFNNLKKVVIAAKENYLNSIQNYSDKLNEVRLMKDSMDSIRDNISKDTRDKIMKILNKHNKDFYPVDDMFIKDFDNEDISPKIHREATSICVRSNWGI